MTVTPADHRYLQVARTLRKEIVDGVYPVGSQLPTEQQLCERFEVSRYTVREALRRLRDDNLVASRPRAGTLVVPRPEASSSTLPDRSAWTLPVPSSANTMLSPGPMATP